MYDSLLEDLEPEQFKLQQQLLRKQSYKPALDKIEVVNEILESKSQGTNFRVYFAIEKLQICLKDSSLKQDDYLGIM